MVCKRKHVFIRLIWIARYFVPNSYDNGKINKNPYLMKDNHKVDVFLKGDRKILSPFKKKKSISAVLTVPKPLTMWITINCGKF